MADLSSPRDVLAALSGDDLRASREVLMALEAGELAADAAVVARLIELLASASKEVRRRAAGALAVAAADRAHGSALERALSDGEPRRRWGAAFALARAGVGGEAVAHAAIDALDDVDGDVRWAAAEIVCANAATDDGIRQTVLTAARSASPLRRKMALYCARNLTAGDSALYLDALRDADAGVRLAALSGLSRIAPAGAATVAALIASMRSDVDAGVRRAAAAALGKTAAGHGAAREALEEIERTTDDADLRRAALGALRAIAR